ncbi:MAG: hypothetical protein IKJ27_06430 [Clostridia bacterium]|nr:hypothetical protein [Clostridia bacterium]
MKKDRGKKIAAGVLIFVFVTLLLYVAQFFYFDKSGIVETEYATSYIQKDVLTADGFAVRDEFREENGVNSSVLLKKSDKIYIPLVEDSSGVAINDAIAVCFDNRNQADTYLQIKSLEDRINDLSELKSYEELSKISMSYLNSKTYKHIHDYVGQVSDGDFNSIENTLDSFCSALTSKQIATGYSYDFGALIDDYNGQIKSLESLISNKEYVSSPYAGYFVSVVDGYEQAKSYADVKNKKVDANETASLLGSKPQNSSNAYGKIIAQHTWFLLCDISIEDTASIKTGKTVYVDFPERDIHKVPMTVYDVSDTVDGKVTVTFRCKYLNEELASLRKEKLTITVAEYEGYKISNEALIKNDEGLDGVYVLAGNVAYFTPIHIMYYGDDYVVAEKYTAYFVDEDGNKTVDTEKTELYRELKAFDSIIVKGTNISDGKVIR